MTKGLVGNEYKEEGLMSNSSGMLYRIKTEYKVNNTLQKTVYYIGNYECEVYPNGRLREINYINTSTGHTIVQLKDNKNNIPTDSLYYIFKDHLGSYDRITNQLGQIVETYSFDAWGNRRNPNNWQYSPTSMQIENCKFTRGFTGHEHMDKFQLINMNGRLYDPVIARFLSVDPYVQIPNNTQNFNRYSYCLNNPLLYTDPSGELFLIDDILIGAAVGCIVNFWIQGFSGNINGTGDALSAMGIGALSGGIGAGVGSAVSLGLGSATTLSSAIGNGMIIGGSGGFAGGFVGGAGSAWANGATFSDGLTAGLITGGIGAVSGAIIGGISGGMQYQKQISLFQKGCVDFGVNSDNPVPATDKFLSDAQKAWYPDAPMSNIKAFTVENVPESHLTGKNGLIPNNAAAKTVPLSVNKVFTGNSNVYFNKNLAFNSAKQLFFTMGHEFVHVSQFAALAGQSTSLLSQPSFIDLLEFHAYSYQHYLGGLQLNSFTTDVVRGLSAQNPTYFNTLGYRNFPWTSNSSFIYPF